MMNLLFACLMTMAPHAEAFPFPQTFDGIFDGRAAVEPDIIPKFRPRSVVLPPGKTDAAFIAVVVELRVMPVSDLDRQSKILDSSLAGLSRGHGFIRDMGSEPRIQDSADASTAPGGFPVPRSFVYEVRGFIPSERFAALAADKAVAKARVDPSGAPLSEEQSLLLGFFSSHLDRLLAVPGAAAAGLGWDCLAKGEHVHIMPHRPAIVVEASASIDPLVVRAAILKSLPELSDKTFVVTSRRDPAPLF